MPDKNAPSLENLIESFDLGEEALHPGRLATTKELADLCHVGSTTRILDVASGTGVPLCFLVETFHCQGVGVDFSEAMVRRAHKKAEEKNLQIEFRQGDAHHLPFDGDTFDVAISECTICLLNKGAALKEMVRVPPLQEGRPRRLAQASSGGPKASGEVKRIGWNRAGWGSSWNRHAGTSSRRLSTNGNGVVWTSSERVFPTTIRTGVGQLRVPDR